MELVPMICVLVTGHLADKPTHGQRRRSKYILGGRARRRGGGVIIDFGSQNGNMWCILGAIFCSLAKTLRGRKDTLAQVYFYWGGGNRPPRPRDRRHWSPVRARLRNDRIWASCSHPCASTPTVFVINRYYMNLLNWVPLPLLNWRLKSLRRQFIFCVAKWHAISMSTE